jgi:hypothetical protein
MLKSPDEIRQEKIEEILTSTESKWSVSDDVVRDTTQSKSSLFEKIKKLLK